MKPKDAVVESLLRSKNLRLNCPTYNIAVLHYTHIWCNICFMNKFEFKNLVKSLRDTLKQKTFLKDLRKEVETGANGTQDYVVKKGVNKDTVATTRQ